MPRRPRSARQQIRQACMQHREQAFGHLSQLAASSHVGDVLKIVEQGYAPTLIQHAVRRVEADLAALGNDNASRLRGCFFRSVASEVMARSDCDILVVPSAA